MKLIIDIPEGIYNRIIEEDWGGIMTTAIKHGAPYEERPQGNWIRRHIITKDRSFDMVVCSNCQTEFSWDAETGISMDNYKTCPKCDAKME